MIFRSIYYFKRYLRIPCGAKIGQKVIDLAFQADRGILPESKRDIGMLSRNLI